MKEEKIFEKIITFSIGSFYFLEKNFKKLLQEIEEEGQKHTNDFENIKKGILKLIKIPKNLLVDFLKSCDFITKEDIKKFIEEMKNG